eukprot:4178913-Pyramimonas_sp.AAC.1
MYLAEKAVPTAFPSVHSYSDEVVEDSDFPVLWVEMVPKGEMRFPQWTKALSAADRLWSQRSRLNSLSPWTSKQTIASRISLRDALESYVFVELYQLHVTEALVVRVTATVSPARGISSSEARRRLGCRKGRNCGCQAPVSLYFSCAS